MEIVQNNYFRGHGHGLDWNVEIDPPLRPVKNYYEETVIAAEQIWSQRQGPLYLMYSGGLDSEYVLSIFLKLGMKVTPVIMRMNNDYNAHDIDYAFWYCEERNLKPTVIDLDFDKFVESGELIRIAEDIKCSVFQLPATMWLASQLDGTVITGNDPPHIKLNKNDNLWYLDEPEYNHTLVAYWEKYNIYGTPYFTSYTPEMMLSFLIDPVIEDLANNKFPGKEGSHSTKIDVYNRDTGFNLVQRTKQTGYELIRTSPIFDHPDIQTIRSWRNKWYGNCYFQYHDLVARLSNGEQSKKLTN
jgi:hypothetical protein